MDEKKIHTDFMKDINRNTRTFIVCFVIAIFSLIPLRFYEVGNQMALVRDSQVLGLVEEVVLPDSQVDQVELEYPYEQIESQVNNCVSQAEVDERVESIVEVLKNPDLDRQVVDSLISEIDRLEGSVCK